MRLETPVTQRLCRAASFATQHGDSAECLTRVWKTEQRSRNIRKNSSGLGLAEEERHTPDTSTVIPWAEVPEWIKRTKWTESQPSSWASYWAQAQCGQLPYSPATMPSLPWWAHPQKEILFWSWVCHSSKTSDQFRVIQTWAVQFLFLLLTR